MDRRYCNFKLAALASALAFAGLAQAGPVSDEMLGAEAGDSWLHANGNWAAHRYSTLSQLNPGNAKDLKGRLGVLAGRQDRCAEHAAVSRRHGVFRAG